jgi:RNA polymerase sigma factor (sigma-70 family)
MNRRNGHFELSLFLMSAAPGDAYLALIASIHDRFVRRVASKGSGYAEDLAQDVMITLMEKADEYRHITKEEELFALAIGIFVRKKLGAWRTNVRRGLTTAVQPETIQLEDPSLNPERALLRTSIEETVRDAIASLDESCRALMGLSLQGFKSAEIQAKLKRSADSVDSALKRCKNRLRERLDGVALGDL